MIADAQVQLAGTYNPSTNGFSPVLITALGSTIANVIDAGPLPASQPTPYGAGYPPVEVTISIMQTLTSAGAATVQFQLIQADDAALTTNARVLVQTDAFAYTVLTQGTRVARRLRPPDPFIPQRYVGLRVVIGTAVLTNASGWLLASVGDLHHDIGTGRGVIFKAGYSVL